MAKARGKRHVQLSPGSKQERKGRTNRKTKLRQEAWNQKLQELVLQAPKELNPVEQLEWAIQQINRQYRQFSKGKRN